MNTVTITNPSEDVTTDVRHIAINLDSRTMNVGPFVVAVSDDFIAELKKNLNTELPKDTKYKSHDMQIVKAI